MQKKSELRDGDVPQWPRRRSEVADDVFTRRQCLLVQRLSRGYSVVRQQHVGHLVLTDTSEANGVNNACTVLSYSAPTEPRPAQGRPIAWLGMRGGFDVNSLDQMSFDSQFALKRRAIARSHLPDNQRSSSVEVSNIGQTPSDVPASIAR